MLNLPPALHSHGGDRRSEQAKADQAGNNENVASLKRSEMNTRKHVLARLDDKRPDLAARVRAKQMTANAAAIEAGFRKPPKRKELIAFDRVMKLLPQLTPEERAKASVDVE
jgi:hypothetical protein